MGAAPCPRPAGWAADLVGPGEEGRAGGTLPCLSSENPQAWPQPLSSPTTPQAHKAPFPEPCQSRGKGRGPALRASVLHPPTGPMHSHVHTHTEQGREHSRGPSQHCGRWKAQTHAHLLPAQARSSRGLGRDPLRQDRSSPDSCLHLSSLLHQPVPAEPGSPLRPPHPRPLSVRLSAASPSAASLAGNSPPSPSPVHRGHCSSPAGPCPLSQQGGSSRPCPHPPLPNPPSGSLICQSVCRSICPTSFFPPSSRSLSALCVPSITSQTALPSQAVTACLSVCPPAHPSFCLPSHPSRHSHLSKLATICKLPVGPPEVPPASPG